MRVGLTSYPMLFQRSGGLQVQLFSTLSALQEIGVETKIFDPVVDRLTDFGVLHVFGAVHGNHEIVLAARHAGLACIVSPILQPLSKTQAMAADILDRLVGRASGWLFRSSFHHVRQALQEADAVVSLGKKEKRTIVDCFGVPSERVHIVPNGIAEAFFKPEAGLFAERYAVNRDFVLCVAGISPYKNQLGLIRAIDGTGLDLVLIGPCVPQCASYLEECKAVGGDNLHYLGPLAHDDPLLASAYAAARTFALVSRSECAPLSALEALAAGTPVVLTCNNNLDLVDASRVVKLVDPDDVRAVREAILTLAGSRIRKQDCVDLVADHSWINVAKALKPIYHMAADPALRTPCGHAGTCSKKIGKQTGVEKP